MIDDSAIVEPIPGPAPQARRGPNRRSLAIVLGLHLLMLSALLEWQPSLPAARTGAGRGTAVFFDLPKPKPPPNIAQPAASGVKLAAHPSPGVPAAKTIEHALTKLPRIDLAPTLERAAVTDPLPQLASIDVAAGAVGSGGSGVAGAGAGASTGKGAGKGGGRLFGDCADTPDRSMVADVYRLRRNSDSVDAMHGLKPIKRVCLSQLDVAPRSFREGFPGMDGLIEWFGLDIRFTVNVPEAGTWDLVLISDDGAILTIDDVQVIDNDGQHKPLPKFAEVRLAAGPRRFRVRYFQGPREAIALMLAWKKPGEARFDYIPRSLLGRPSAM